MHSCQNNLEKSYTEKNPKHMPSGYSLFTNCWFDVTKNKLDGYNGEDWMERFCKDLREQATKTIDYEKKINDTANHGLLDTRPYMSHLKAKIKRPVFQKNATK